MVARSEDHPGHQGHQVGSREELDVILVVTVLVALALAAAVEHVVAPATAFARAIVPFPAPGAAAAPNAAETDHDHADDGTDDLLQSAAGTMHAPVATAHWAYPP